MTIFNTGMKRIFDLLIGVFCALVFIIPALLIAFAVRATSPGPVLHWSKRVGRDNKIFLMPKFRTMMVDTPQVATHLMPEPRKYLTSIGSFLRRSSLDELPQIISVLQGDLSLVGPRPALFNQDDLVSMRTEAGVHSLRPGITGWAQINGRDELPIPVKVRFDQEYLQKQSIWFDIEILALTFVRVVARHGVQH